MRRFHRVLAGAADVCAALLLCVAFGCQTAPRSAPATAAPTTQSSPTDVMARSDAERAEDAIEQNQREMSGERRPRDMGRDRVVDQPRVSGGRR